MNHVHTLNTPRFLKGLFLLLVIAFAGCGTKKCQPPETEKFKTITGMEWRMVETTDPSPGFKKLSNTTFYIFTFGTDYRGMVNLVINNTKRDNPEFNMIYNIDPSSGSINIKYEKPATEDATGSGESEAPATNVSKQANQSGVIPYNYELNRQLEMTNTRNGAYYRFVPFKGIIEPDNQCEF